jgi:hypothetical protein
MAQILDYDQESWKWFPPPRVKWWILLSARLPWYTGTNTWLWSRFLEKIPASTRKVMILAVHSMQEAIKKKKKKTLLCTSSYDLLLHHTWLWSRFLEKIPAPTRKVLNLVKRKMPRFLPLCLEYNHAQRIKAKCVLKCTHITLSAKHHSKQQRHK